MLRVASRGLALVPVGAALLASAGGSAPSAPLKSHAGATLPQRLQRRLQLLALYAGSSNLHCEVSADASACPRGRHVAKSPAPPLTPFALSPPQAEPSSSQALDDVADRSDLMSGGTDGDDVTSDGLNPGDFNQREDEKSFSVQPSEGIMLLMQSSMGPPGRDGAALATQMSFSSSGVSNVWILSDQKAPGLQAVLQPGPEGAKFLKLVVSGKPAAIAGLSLDAETLLASAGVQNFKATGKLNGDDFYATLSVAPFGGQGPPNAEFAYHQTMAPGWTAGGTLAGAFGPMLPVPVLQKLAWGTYGSWTEPRRRESAAYVRLGAQPRQDGSTQQTLNVQSWRRVSKGLELGANLNVCTIAGASPSWFPLLPVPAGVAESGAGAGGRMTFEGSGGLNPVLTAHFSTAGVASLQWQKPSASGVTNTFMRTTLSAVLDHPRKDYKFGAQVELYY
jgi:hypothetical protein